MTKNWSKPGEADSAAPETVDNQNEQVAAPENPDDEPELREVGTVVDDDVAGLPFEVRKDGSIAHFTQETAEHQQLREVGS